MLIDYGNLGPLPYAALGDGQPLIIVAGLSPTTGFRGGLAVRAALGPLVELAASRRIVVLNRRPGLPTGITMAEIAAEHREALSAGFGDRRLDVIGLSTGGSIAQQVAADHPELIQRLVLISTACRLGPYGRSLQRTVAAKVRRGARRQAIATLAAGLIPPRRGRLAVAAAALVTPHRLFADAQGIDDMATTIEAEDAFDLTQCPPIQAPTLLLAGRNDRFYAPSLFQETADMVSGCRLHLFDKRGHITVMRDPAFRSETERFLSD